MELRHYWAIIRPRLWIVVLLTVVAFGVSAIYTPQTSASYRSSVKLALKPQLDVLSKDYGEYYPYLASEFLNDDIGMVIESGAFLAELRDRAARQHGRTPSGFFEAKKAHRVLIVDAIANTPGDALLLAMVAVEMLTAPDAGYFDTITAQSPRVTVIDPPAIVSSTPASRIGLDIALRTFLGLLLGLGLAFFLHYLDNTFRSSLELEEALGLPVLGEVPADTKGLRANR